MNARILLFGAPVAVASASVAPRARAADPLAEMLYQEGRAAAHTKNWELACRKFRESHDREPAPGTLLNLGDCEENRGRLLVALAAFESAARLFPAGEERVTYAKQRAAAIDRRIPRLTVRLHPTSPTGTTILRDGLPVDAATLGSPIGVDPGEHVLVVRAPGRSDARTTLRLAEGESREVELTAGMLVEPGETRESAMPAPAPTSSPALAEGATPPKDGPEPERTLGFVALGLGAAGVVVGAIGGIATINAKSTADANCPAAGCNPTGTDAESRGKTWSAVSMVGFIVGGAGLAAGAGLLLFAPKKSTSVVAARPLPGGAGLQWAGTF